MHITQNYIYIFRPEGLRFILPFLFRKAWGTSLGLVRENRFELLSTKALELEQTCMKYSLLSIVGLNF
jgi:hypothetical protein